MPTSIWDGTDWVPGGVFLWDGTALVPGVIRRWPWSTIGTDPIVDVIDGGTASTFDFAAGIDGGAPSTTHTDIFDGGALS